MLLVGRAEINDTVRQGLDDEGVLHGPELEIERYVNQPLGAVEHEPEFGGSHARAGIAPRRLRSNGWSGEEPWRLHIHASCVTTGPNYYRRRPIALSSAILR